MSNPAEFETSEQGSAVVEMAVLGSLIFGVLMQVVVLFGVAHRAALATAAAAREGGRAAVMGDTQQEASDRASIAVAQATINHGIAPEDMQMTFEGQLVRGSSLRVTARVDVPILQIPFVGPVWPSLSIPVETATVVKIDRYRGFPE